MFSSETKMHKLFEFSVQTWWVVCFEISSRNWFFLMSKRKEKTISSLEKPLLCIMILLLLWVMLGPFAVKWQPFHRNCLGPVWGWKVLLSNVCFHVPSTGARARQKANLDPIWRNQSIISNSGELSTQRVCFHKIESTTGRKSKCFRRRNLWKPQKDKREKLLSQWTKAQLHNVTSAHEAPRNRKGGPRWWREIVSKCGCRHNEPQETLPLSL